MTSNSDLPFTWNVCSFFACFACYRFILHLYQSNLLFSVCLHVFANRPELSELYKPLEDPLIESCMEILDLAKDGKPHGSRMGSIAQSFLAKVFPRPRRSWLPTGCLVRSFNNISNSYNCSGFTYLCNNTTLKYTETPTSST